MKQIRFNTIGPSYVIASSIAAIAIGTAAPAYEQLPGQLEAMEGARLKAGTAMENMQVDPKADREEFRIAQNEFDYATTETGLIAGRALMGTLVAGIAIWGASRSITVGRRREGTEVRLSELLVDKS